MTGASRSRGGATAPELRLPNIAFDFPPPHRTPGALGRYPPPPGDLFPAPPALRSRHLAAEAGPLPTSPRLSTGPPLLRSRLLTANPGDRGSPARPAPIPHPPRRRALERHADVLERGTTSSHVVTPAPALGGEQARGGARRGDPGAGDPRRPEARGRGMKAQAGTRGSRGTRAWLPIGELAGRLMDTGLGATATHAGELDPVVHVQELNRGAPSGGQPPEGASVAADAAQAQVRGIVRTTVLSSDDGVDLVRQNRRALGKPAVLTRTLSAPLDQLARFARKLHDAGRIVQAPSPGARGGEMSFKRTTSVYSLCSSGVSAPSALFCASSSTRGDRSL